MVKLDFTREYYERLAEMEGCHDVSAGTGLHLFVGKTDVGKSQFLDRIKKESEALDKSKPVC